MAKKSKHAFGSEQNVDSALISGALGAYDVLFLNEGKIGWIDKNGNKVILEDKEQVILLDDMPESGRSDVLYIYKNVLYLWNGTSFVAAGGSGSMSEDLINQKIDEAKDEVLTAAKKYADDQLAASVENEVVEF